LSAELEQLRKQYQVLSTWDLLRVLGASQDYRPEAVQAAREVLATRDKAELEALTPTVRGELDGEHEASRRQAGEPLTPGVKALCFVFLIPGLIFAAHQSNQGHTQRARDALRWALYGLFANVVLIVVCHL